MATTIGPDMPVEASGKDSFVQSSSTRHLPVPITIDNIVSSQLGPSSPQLSPRSHPLPNPPFVFPARPSSPSSAPSSYSRASGRRSKSALESQERGLGVTVDNVSRKARSPALPDFSFNPGASLSPGSDHTFLSPPQSPASPRAIPTRPSGGGHRRGGSEFVGGKLRDGEAITVMSTSPTKSESGMASPQLKPAHPPRGRGHAHRRSAAISSHDLSMILQPSKASPPLRGSSAPSSPADFDRERGDSQYAFPKTQAETPKSDTVASPVASPVAQEVVRSNTPPVEARQAAKPASRARVGFSDTLEFIPRPLSLVSSDTSSTITARPGHSVSGSISSVISLTNSAAADRDSMSPLARSPSRCAADSRPSTAGAVLERTESTDAAQALCASPRRRNSIPVLISLPAPDLTNPATPSPSKTPKRWSFFGLEPFIGTGSPTRSRPVSSSSSESTPKSAKSNSSSEQIANALTEEPVKITLPQKPVGRKASKTKKKKVKSWAGSILTRKSKPRRKSRRAPTPPPRAQEQVDDDVSDEPDEVFVGSDTPTVLVDGSCPPEADFTSWQPRPSPPQDDDASFPMIDLDAALGPFNTPLPRNAEWEAAQRAGGLTKRQLHSAAGMSRFTGPGMHYSHRRAESAPEMPPFNRAGMPRYSSNSTMADVFEEDEEAEEEGAGGETTSNDATLEAEHKRASIDITVTESCVSPLQIPQEVPDDAASSAALSRRGSGLSGFSDDDRTQPSMGLKSEYSASSLHEEVIVEEPSDFAFASNSDGCAFDSSDSTTPSPRRILKGKELAPVDVSPLHLPATSLAPISPYSMTHSSAFPSPRSPMSYDANRISTAPSSITEDNFQSLLMGEPGPEVRLSSDIPSLTSSNSTMTRESVFAQGPQARSPLPSRGDRPASFTGTAFGRRRSSLASLHRLISTSHGERSKLSMEVSCESEPEKKPRVSKTKRLSRMMQFWKPKESSG